MRGVGAAGRWAPAGSVGDSCRERTFVFFVCLFYGLSKERVKNLCRVLSGLTRGVTGARSTQVPVSRPAAAGAVTHFYRNLHGLAPHALSTRSAHAVCSLTGAARALSQEATSRDRVAGAASKGAGASRWRPPPHARLAPRRRASTADPDPAPAAPRGAAYAARRGAVCAGRGGEDSRTRTQDPGPIVGRFQTDYAPLRRSRTHSAE